MPPHQPVEFIGDAHHRDQQQQMHPDTDQMFCQLT